MMKINLTHTLIGADGPLHLNIDVDIHDGELVSLYGPTGSGKSSILRMIAGLMKPDDGTIEVDRAMWYSKSNRLFTKPQYRHVGIVFQDYSLFPNMTVRENLTFALPQGEPTRIVDELLDITELKNLQHKKPHLLSGGQKQRIALTRALVRKPRVLLLDEPLSALDSEMRAKLQDYILKFHAEFKLKTILVSHDLPEIMKLSNRVLVLEGGRIIKDCPPRALIA
ncbi:ABC transporter ATP-binding protein [Pseudochryseolinea flava]|uniref:ABC transporter ATP-binding protein n=1 Tax=Pseudochryseolinea flava TaxID=2059302 RepID=A0A364Y5Y9_9BACT|nr:ATP-binding cassette domain-containing protein [Pseudochryseolinea flava]RAW02373.1 ABC transporter ATP-binding protein [Pseudochryseolinea flava]